MRVYFITKKAIIRLLLFTVLILSSIIVVAPYKDVVIDVFNAKHDTPIYSVEIPQKKVSITFDCAWGGEDIPQLIDILNKYNIKATFFIVGSWMDKYPENVKALYKAGHEIANHSDNHLDMTGISEETIRNEIINADQKIEKLTGSKNNLFRAPYGAYNDKLLRTAKSIDRYVIQWDVDSLDWKELGVDSIISRVTEKVKNGSIILFHNDTKYTLQSLPSVIEKLKSQGYEFVKVSELIMKENYYIDHQGRQQSLIKERTSID